MKELDTTQCTIWAKTSSMCAKPQSTTQSVPNLCYECTIVKESSHMALPDLDRKARGLLTGLTDQINEGKERSRFREKVTKEAVEQLGRYVDIYSCKVQVAEQNIKEERGKRVAEREKRLRERAKRESERSEGSERDNELDKGSSDQTPIRGDQGKFLDDCEAVPEKKLPANYGPEKGRLRELETKINSITQFWRDRIRGLEEQMEAAGRSHSAWRLGAIMSELDAAHNTWNMRIEEAFEDAKNALK